MTNYTELIKALRCKRDDCEGCDLAFLDNDEGWMCQYSAKDDDAADAIDALQAEVKILKVSGREAYFEGLAADDNGRQVEILAKRNAELHAELEKWVSAAEKAGEPKRGEWVDGDNFEDPFLGKFRCSVCGHAVQAIEYNYEQKTVRFASGKTEYCPNCGAKMEAQE